MPEQNFQIQSVALTLSDELELVECHGFPEVSSLGDKPGRGAVGLRSKVRTLLANEDATPPATLHRRLTGKNARVEEATLTVAPPKNRADWTQPVDLRFAYITWTESDDLHLAFVPGLGLQVIASKADQIAPRVEAHIRMALVDRAARVTLKDLAQSQVPIAIRVNELQVSATIKTPRERAEQKGAESKPASVLKAVATKLTRLNTSPAFEMEHTLHLMQEALDARQPPSVLLIGPPGVGKTAAVCELARSTSKQIWSTSGAQLIAGQSGFGEWQERCRDLCKEAAQQKVILHLGNLLELMEVGQHSANAQSIASFLRPMIARGHLMAIAECTPEQLAIIERRDPHIAGAFMHVRVAEPTAETTRKILDSVFHHLARKDSVHAQSAAALDWLHRLHRRYATYSANPGRVIRFLTTLVAEQPIQQKTVINVEQVTTAFTRETGLPEVLLNDAIPLDSNATRHWFTQRVIGQTDAIDAVLELLSTIKSRLNRPHQPLASFLFVGPTGTGKTELAKSLAEFLFGSPNRLARFDLSEFKDSLSVQRLIGSPGHAEGLLTARVREQPFSVLLLDEFEKADPAFFDLLLQILGDGRLTDGAGRVADFCNTVIIMTSNLGAREFQRGSVGFGTGDDGSGHFDHAVRQFLRPEIYNRLGAILRFQSLSRDLMLRVTHRHLGNLRLRDGLRLRNVELQLGPGVEEYLAARGHDPKYGARPLKRVLEQELMVPLAEVLNNATTEEPLISDVRLEKDRLIMELQRLGTKADSAASQQATLVAEGAVSLRRRLVKLAKSQTVSALENEIPLLGMLLKRRKTKRTLSAEDQAGLARLTQIQKALEQLSALTQRTDQLETETLCTFHLGGTFDTKAFWQSQTALQNGRKELQREFFRLSFANPNDIVIALYSEHRDWMQVLLQIYLEHVAAMEGKLVAFEFVLPPQPEMRDVSKDKLRRDPPKNMKEPLAKPPTGWVGAILQLRGELFQARFAFEAGFHKHILRGVHRVCLIEVATGSFSDYVPPSGIHRAGAISDKGIKARRTFNEDESKMIDAVIGDSAWTRPDPSAAIRRLIEQRFSDALEEIV